MTPAIFLTSLKNHPQISQISQIKTKKAIAFADGL
jgi:hypothetical protein